MLKSWSIENFKPIVNSGELQFAPVTVLAGRNSSGKSSLLQSILMIAQTLSNQLPERALLPNGPLVQLGTFEDILSTISGSRNLTVQFEISNEREDIGQGIYDIYRSSNHKVTVSFSSGNDDNSSSSAIEASRVVVEKTSIIFHFENVGTDSENPTIINGNFATERVPEAEDNLYDRFSGSTTPERFLRIFSSIQHKPNYLGEFVSYNETDHKDEGAREFSSETFLVTLFHFLPIELISNPQVVPDFIAYLPGQKSLEEAVKLITRFFSSQIRYLGPLRADPDTTQRTYAPTSQLDDVGESGEYAAVAYHHNQLARIEWYNPFNKQVEQGTLQEALNSWSRYLGVAEQVNTEMSGSMGIAWKVLLKQGQKERTLPEVGVGLSQILPILVMGLLSPGNSFLIVEQPELHLHSRVQARLGDFFVGLSKCKKQCLIETHSENLVSQLRYHIVQAGGMENSDCMIYFVDQDEKGAAKFEQVEISPRGNIMNWPDGFFDETMHQEDRITSASIRRRAKLAKNG